MAKNTFSVKIHGLKEVAKALHDELPKGAAKGVMRTVLRRRAKPMLEFARSLAPVRTGKLKTELTMGSRLSKRQAKVRRRQRKAEGVHRDVVEVFVGQGSDSHHAHLQEFGTVKHGPSPFLRPAWRAYQNSLIKDLPEDMRKEIYKRAAAIRRRQAKVARGG